MKGTSLSIASERQATDTTFARVPPGDGEPVLRDRDAWLAKPGQALALYREYDIDASHVETTWQDNDAMLARLQIAVQARLTAIVAFSKMPQARERLPTRSFPNLASFSRCDNVPFLTRCSCTFHYRRQTHRPECCVSRPG